MSIVDCVKNNHINAVVTRYSEGRCKLKLGNLTDYVVLKGEELCINIKICDFIIFSEEKHVIVGVVELKSKSVHVREIMEKLNNGLNTALQILEECADYLPPNTKIKLCPLVLYRRISTQEHRVLKSKKLIVRGRKIDVFLRKCGASFSRIISECASFKNI